MLQMSICSNSNVNSNEIRIYGYIYDERVKGPTSDPI